ncbi:methylated-DNA--[protein]-cysteine S-methyltransferase [Flexithrix dorotheae]|uniref:methylated-DNA--[protein]-cysteine S-methyltransferase n=1 Tax=Flexithrix dorotheae TaxID=70993 RepID=UPI0003757846|nr:methylated-DNA--[protein]-cysteine S-methyltransferase [Flexithrix dorotheae]
MDKLFFSYLNTSLGKIEITGNNQGVQKISFIGNGDENHSSLLQNIIPDCLIEANIQLNEYFQKKRKSFDLKLNPTGTDFQLKVWNQLNEIPFGQTISYKELAHDLGNEKLIRAVGGANGQNPIAVVIPCHRVIGKNYDLIGYAGGVWRKKWLLIHEQVPQFKYEQMSLF